MLNKHISNTPIVITGIGLVCPHASNITELQKANAEAETATVLDSGDWFEPTRFLGARGYKYWTPATRYIQAATGLALEDAALGVNSYDLNAIGVSLGTNFGNTNIIRQMDETLLQEGAESLSPMTGPNFSINIPSSYVSIKYGFKAYNITLVTPMIAGLEALWCAKESLVTGRAKMALAGALEDNPPSPVNKLLGNERGYSGACVFVLETLSSVVERGAEYYAELGKGAIRFISPELLESSDHNERVRKTLRQMIDDVLPAGINELELLSLDYSVTFNSQINQYIKNIMLEKQIKILHSGNYIGTDGSYAAMSPLLQLAMGVTQVREGLMVATSPQGHIVMFAFRKVNGSDFLLMVN